MPVNFNRIFRRSAVCIIDGLCINQQYKSETLPISYMPACGRIELIPF